MRAASRVLAVLAATAILATAAPAPASAQKTDLLSYNGEAVRSVTVAHHKSRTVKLDMPFHTAVVGAPEIADVLPMSETVIYIQGKRVGTTNVSVFDKEKQLITVIDVEVTIDAEHIAESIQSSIESPGIRVASANDQVVLSGTAKDATDAERAVSIAKAMAPTAAVINAMKVSQPQQVMLKVRYLEVNRKAAREIGVNWYGANQRGDRGINTGIGGQEAAGANPLNLPLFDAARTFASGGTNEPFSVAVANILNNGVTLDVMISALEKKGLVRLLAEPNLVALSGDKASFFAGGEIPVPIIQPSSGPEPLITIEYKKFGVELSFQPTVLSAGLINLSMAPSVSELDFANAVVVQGLQIPALSTRATKTTVELRSGQSFAVSGLLQSEGLRDISQVPWLGSVPVLGALFRSSSYQHRETDLVVIVTPHLVAPAAPGQQLVSPLDQRIPPNDVDFFLNGRMDLRKRYRDYVASGGEIKGPYGHILDGGGPHAVSQSHGSETAWKR
jgi:pilus assembly protein CpaC